MAQVGERIDRVLKRAAALLPEGDVVLVAHGHVLRVLTARWLGLPPAGGRLFRLDTGTVSTLGTRARRAGDPDLERPAERADGGERERLRGRVRAGPGRRARRGAGSPR